MNEPGLPPPPAAAPAIPPPPRDGGPLSPTHVLRLLRLLHADPAVEPAQRSAVTWVILAAENGTGLAWASYRGIRAATGLSRTTISLGLHAAEGKYLARAGRGPRGAMQWRVLTGILLARDLPGASGPATGPVAASGPATGPVPASGPATGPVPASGSPPAVQPLAASGPATGPILTFYTNDSLKKQKKQKQRRRRAKVAAPADARVKVFIDWFCTAYQEAHGRAYIVAGAKDGSLVKDLLRRLEPTGDAVEQLKTAATAMLHDKWGRDRASIGLLSTQINTWLKQGGTTTAAGRNRYAKGF